MVTVVWVEGSDCAETIIEPASNDKADAHRSESGDTCMPSASTATPVITLLWARALPKIIPVPGSVCVRLNDDEFLSLEPSRAARLRSLCFSFISIILSILKLSS
eukprot:CAMPEP_0182435788 /NCGR_PEP_ID=MMETSP1167-20130531/77653_1 /TAXON_ID=2988 /ORGANISM="Mallomonas Sp, Strain CCMP3275" /LENGTH=104 /DNA_ID=CAMNT_0024627205 /DNA_START=290 /DNA_END=600 /DNA_ORIENTATION=-